MDLKSIRGIGHSYEEKLKNAGVDTIEKLAISNVEKVAEKSKIPIKKLEKWKEEARKMVDIVKAEIIEDIRKISFIEIEDGKARVKIKDYWHDAKLFEGNFDEIKGEAEKEKIAVYISRKSKLWFNGEWYDGIAYKKKRMWFMWRK